MCELIIDSFDRLVDRLRGQILQLGRAISGCRFLDAWCESRELTRLFQQAVQCISSLPERDRPVALVRVSALREIAAPVLELAPNPSRLALRQARSADWTADRAAWLEEEQAWLEERQADGAPLLYRQRADNDRCDRAGHEPEPELRCAMFDRSTGSDPATNLSTAPGRSSWVVVENR